MSLQILRPRWLYLYLSHWVCSLEQSGVHCLFGAPLTVHNSRKRSLHSLSQHIIQLGLQRATFQLRVTTSLYFSATVIHTHNSPRTSSLCSVFSPGADPSLAALTDVFKDTGCWGNKSAEIPNLNGALRSIIATSNCNRKAIITYSSSGRERLFAQRLQLIRELVIKVIDCNWCKVIDVPMWSSTKSNITKKNLHLTYYYYYLIALKLGFFLLDLFMTVP